MCHARYDFKGERPEKVPLRRYIYSKHLRKLREYTLEPSEEAVSQAENRVEMCPSLLDLFYKQQYRVIEREKSLCIIGSWNLINSYYYFTCLSALPVCMCNTCMPGDH